MFDWVAGFPLLWKHDKGLDTCPVLMAVQVSRVPLLRRTELRDYAAFVAINGARKDRRWVRKKKARA